MGRREAHGQDAAAILPLVWQGALSCLAVRFSGRLSTLASPVRTSSIALLRCAMIWPVQDVDGIPGLPGNHLQIRLPHITTDKRQQPTRFRQHIWLDSAYRCIRRKPASFALVVLQCETVNATNVRRRSTRRYRIGCANLDRPVFHAVKYVANKLRKQTVSKLYKRNALCQ